MDRSANVKSLDAVRNFRGALAKFEEGARDGLTLLELEVRRAVDWIEQDRRRYWPSQAKQASDELAEARHALELCKLKYSANETPSCQQEKKAVERAKQRLRLCEEKIQQVKHWIRAVRQELNEFEGQMSQMTTTLDADLPRAMATLGRMLAALDKYSGGQTRLPSGQDAVPRASLPPPSGTAESRP